MAAYSLYNTQSNVITIHKTILVVIFPSRQRHGNAGKSTLLKWKFYTLFENS
jgi:hypothetical protein